MTKQEKTVNTPNDTVATANSNKISIKKQEYRTARIFQNIVAGSLTLMVVIISLIKATQDTTSYPLPPTVEEINEENKGCEGNTPLQKEKGSKETKKGKSPKIILHQNITGEMEMH